MHILFFISLLVMPAIAGAVTTPTDFKSLVWTFLGIINLIIPVLFGLAFVVFLWGILNVWILGGGDETSVEKGKKILLAGIIGLVVMSGVWGFVSLIQTSLFR